jgi:SAM-dependent methyltransferase
MSVRSTAIRAIRFIQAVLTVKDRRTAKLERPVDRKTFLASILENSSVLEIGPLDRPLLRGPNVFYFDMFDTEKLKVRSVELGRTAEGVPDIHFSSESGDLGVIDRQFDNVISAHSIEHQPDLVAHLEAVARLLAPGGRYFVIMPDKRYSFDHFAPESSLQDVLDAHLEERLVHTEQAVRAHYERHTHNRAIRHWLGVHGTPGSVVDPVDVEELCAHARDGKYVDVHAWTVSPGGFRNIVETLGGNGLIQLRLERMHDTGFGSHEFFAVFVKDQAAWAE